MKRRFLMIWLLGFAMLIVAVFLNHCDAAERKQLVDQNEKESYSLGYQFGANIIKQSPDVSQEVLLRGIRDALSSKDPLLTQEEMKTNITIMRQRILAAQDKAFKEKAQTNLEKSKAFLEENKKKEGVITLPSGLQYKVIKDGSGKIPGKTDTVTVNYRGSFIDSSEFDSSYRRNKLDTLRVDGVVPGWTEALQLMKEGSKWQLFIPPELAYGERGMGTIIGPNSTLIFELELVAVQTDKAEE